MQHPNMYRYDEFDTRFVHERVAQFRDQVARRLSGELTEDQFRPLRLMNGVYLQLHAYMLRVAIPYGTLSSRQVNQLAHIADTYDRGYGHFTTRQNIQYNWPALKDIPDILADLAKVEMHAIQTSGNCIRNVTTDQFAGVAADEIEDPRPVAELIRQWSTLHPEFAYLPRKFKIALTGAPQDRAAVKTHDLGFIMQRGPKGETGFEVVAGGGLGRTPIIAKTIREWILKADILAYIEAVMRVYNRFGRRDNKYKARIKILLQDLGVEEFSRQVEEEFSRIEQPQVNLGEAELARIATYFAPPQYEALDDIADLASLTEEEGYREWANTNLTAHRVPGYSIVTVSLKPIGGIPGDASSEQMRRIADIADEFSFGEIRVSHEQNLVLPNIRQTDLPHVYARLREAGLATANAGLVTDMIACPGMDYCSLATARSIPLAQEFSERFASRQHEIGDLKIKISGCINACGHHHVGHIGILGLDKAGQEFYQITLGGSGDEKAAVGEIVGRGFAGDKVGDAVEAIIDTYVERRQQNETFLDTYRRLGATPFKEALYVAA